MVWSKRIVAVAAAALLTGTMLLATAVASPPAEIGFSALQGVETQALSSEEMAAISGELNAFDIAAALTQLAGTLGKYPRLQASTLKLAAYYTTNAVAINAAFAKFGVLTPCKTC